MGAAEAHGVEFVDELAATAARRGVEVAQHDLNKALPYESTSFDVVHSNQVIEHVAHTDVFVQEIRRVLRPSGYALLSTNNLSSWHNIFSLLIGMQPMPCHVSDERIIGNRFDPRRGERHPVKGATHLRIFAYRGFAELLELHGLRIDKLLTTGFYPFPPRLADFLSRLDRRHGAFLIARATPASSSARSYEPTASTQSRR